MTDSGKPRPRRAFASDDDAQPDGHDDTRSAPSRRARRGAADDFDAPASDAPFQPQTVPASETAIPAPVLPTPEYQPGTAASVPSGWEALELPQDPSDAAMMLERTVPHRHQGEPTPRVEPDRSSTPAPKESKAPAEAEPEAQSEAVQLPEAARPHRKDRRRGRKKPETTAPAATESGDAPGTSVDQVETTTKEPSSLPADSWIAHHKRTLLLWIGGGLVAALVIAAGFFLVSRTGDNAEPSNSASISVSATPIDITDTALMSLDDAHQIDASANWSITDTFDAPSKITRRAACLGVDSTSIHPVTTLQRLLGTTQEDNLALMHQVDIYATEAAAEEIYATRVASLTECTQVPALLTGASSISGLGDAVTQVSVAFENDPTQHHTVLLVRSGRTLQLLDVTRNGQSIPADAVMSGLLRPLNEVCAAAGSTCPASPVVTQTPPLPAEPLGWLIPSDLPRITAGYGVWNAPGQPVDVILRGSGCENMTLATEPGPTGRMQRTLVMTADNAAPKGMGIDEVLFTFADEDAAAAFGDRLAGNIASCAEVMATATVTELEPADGIGVDGIPVTVRMFTVSQATADDTAAHYQLVVARAGSKVSYLLATVGPDYQFSAAQLAAIGIRAGQRATQG